MSDQETKTIDEKIAKLDQKVEWFYSDDFNLEQASANYESANALAKEIEKELSELKNKVEVLQQDFSAD